MELRQLKALLDALRHAGVTSYRDGDLTLEFGDVRAQAVEPDVTGTDDGQALPDGVIDPRAAIQAIYKADKARRKARAA